MTDKKPAIDPSTTRTTRRLPPGVSEIEAGNPDDIFAPPPVGGPAPPTPSDTGPGTATEKMPSPSVDAPPSADTPARTGRATARGKKDEAATEDAITIPTVRVGAAGERITAAAPAQTQGDGTAASAAGDKRRSGFFAGARLNRTMAKVAPSLASKRFPIDLAIGGLVILVVIGGVTWWALAPTSDSAPQQTADTSAPKTSSTGDSAQPMAPPARGDTPAPQPTDTAKGTAPESKPDPGATAGGPATPPAPAGGPPLAPRTGPITEETLDVLKRRAAAGETDSMEELARRYIEGAGVNADAVEGAKWLQRAAELGAPGAMFNIGVMYERGMVLDKDPGKAIDWYTKASAAGVPMATHNMALMYREGTGVALDHKRAHELLLVAARNGMSASMFALASMYEAGSHGLKKDLVQAIVWYAMTLHFQRAHPSTQGSDMAQKADQKVNELQRVLSAADLDRAQTIGEKEHGLIIDTIRTANKLPPASTAAVPPNGSPSPSAPVAPAPKTEPTPPTQSTAPANPATQTVPPAGKPGAPPASGKPPAGPQTAAKSDPKSPATPPPPAAKPMSRKEQLTEIQKMLFALHYYRGKIDGVMGNDTRNAIKKVQATAGLPQTGEPSQELVDVLRDLVGSGSRK